MGIMDSPVRFFRGSKSAIDAFEGIEDGRLFFATDTK